MPKFRRRHLRNADGWIPWAGVAVGSLALVVIAMGWLQWLPDGAVLIAVGGLVAAVGVLVIHEYRMHEYAERHRFQFCEWCAYPLGGLAKRGVCPECGEPYDQEGAEAYWRLRLSKGSDVPNSTEG